MKKIAFFVSGRICFASFLMQLAKAVAEMGIEVDIFYTQFPVWTIDIDADSMPFGLHLVPLKTEFKKFNRRKEVSQFFCNIDREISNIVGISKYSALIGVEKVGLSIAHQMSKKWKTPVIYWSWELYDLEHPWWPDIGMAQCWLELEKIAHKYCVATIIQDKDRAQALCRLTGNESHFIYLPITVDSSFRRTEKIFFLHDYYNLSHEKKVLLQFGGNRIPHNDILRMANSLPNNWIFVLHGHGLYELKKIINHHNVYIFHERIKESDIPNMISSADAGLVHYEKNHINDILTARSSEKLARYLACCVPVIAHDIGNYARMFSGTGACLLYSSPDQVGIAASCIDKNTNFFRQEAKKEGERYIFENVCTQVLNYICELAGN